MSDRHFTQDSTPAAEARVTAGTPGTGGVLTPGGTTEQGGPPASNEPSAPAGTARRAAHERSERLHRDAARRAAPLALLRLVLRNGWRALLLWCLAIAGIGTLYLSLYGSMAEALTVDTALMESFPPEILNAIGGAAALSSGAGYVQATFLGLLGFAVGSVAAIGWGTKAIAGPEEAGDLELHLSHGISRLDYVLQATAAVVIRCLALAATAALVMAALDGPGDLGLETTGILAAGTSYFLLLVLAGCAALAGGAATGRRVAATGAGAAVVVGSYLLNAVGSQSEDTAWMLDLSPYRWAYGHEPLAEGWSAAPLWVLLLLALVWAAGLIRFLRRDLGR